MTNLPFRIRCPNGCVTHGMHSGPDEYHVLDTIFGKDPQTKKSEIMVLKCPKCKFEAWASKEFRDKFGKPDQSYWDSESNSIKSDKLGSDHDDGKYEADWDKERGKYR